MLDFRTTIFHRTLPGGVIVNNPAGLEDAALVLSRNKYHGIIEQFDVDLIFFGEALTLIEQLTSIYGLDDEIRIRIEAAFNRNEWEVLYVGVLDVYGMEKHYDDDVRYKAKIPVIQDNNWTRFINKTGRKVEFLFNQRVNFTGYTIIQRYVRSTTHAITSIAPGIGQGNFLMINTIAAESTIDDRFEYGNQVSNENPINVKKYFIKCRYGGRYLFEYNIGIQFVSVPSGRTLEFFLVKRSGSEVQTISLGTGTTGTGILYYNGTQELNCKVGDEIYLYAHLSGTFTSNVIFRCDFFTGTEVFYSRLVVRAETVHPQSYIYGLSVDSVATGIIDKLGSEADVDTGLDAHLFSGENIGVQNIYGITVGEGGTPWEVIIGIAPPIYFGKVWGLTFDEWYNNIFPLQPIGVDYDNDKVRIRPLDTFYEDTTAPVFLPCHDLIESIDVSKFIKSVKVGFEVIESRYRYDEFKTLFGYATYNSDLTVGDDVELVSKFIAEPIVIEEVRRLEREVEGIAILETIRNEFTDPISGLPIIEVVVKTPVNDNLRLINNNRYDKLISVGVHGKRIKRFVRVDGFGEHRPFYISAVDPYHTPIKLRFKVKMNYEDYQAVKSSRYSVFITDVGNIRLVNFKYYISGSYAEVEGYVVTGERYLNTEDDMLLLL